MGTHNKKETITVESLLRLKRSERPDGEFWDSFENDFQRRRLNALVQRETIRDAFWFPSLKAMSVALPAILLGSVAFFWPGLDDGVPASAPQMATLSPVERPVSLPVADDVSTAELDQELLALSDSRLSSQFVVDAIQTDHDGPLNFRKVLYTPAIHLSSPNGAFYVKDSFSSRTYKVTTADAKFARNF